MFACIRYMDNPEVKHFIECSTIKDFDPHNYQPDVYYLAWWNSPKGAKCDESGYYRAQVLMVAESKEELMGKAENSRIKIKKKIENAHEIEIAGQRKKTSANKKPKNESSASRKVLNDIMTKTLEAKKRKPLSEDLASFDDIMDAEEMLKEITRLKADLQGYQQIKEGNICLKEENNSLKKLNMSLQQALTAKVLQLDSSTETYVTDDYGHVVPIDDNTPAVPNSAPMQITDPVLPVPGTSGIPHVEKFMPIFKGDGTVSLGNDVILSRQNWDHIMMARTPSVFCKELSTAIWQPQVLVGRTVTGQVSNALKNKVDAIPKPRLTPKKLEIVGHCLRYHMEVKMMPEKDISEASKKVNKFINEKIQDLAKRQKTSL